jgi:hypothetical protein
MKKELACTFLMVSCGIAFAGEAPSHTSKPHEGYVPNAETAIRIAIAVWEPIYGKEQITNQKPYSATLNGGVWTVEGTLHGGKYMVGGVAVAEISKEDGKIIRISHGK